jgi:dGTPase
VNWKKLLSTKRVGKATAHDVNHQPPRTEFTRDYDRIIFSSSFRRLQDKTQVFPLAKSDYVRTRLTHSLEVASVGRSLGMLAAEVIRQKDSSLDDAVIPQDVGTIVAAACLAHDIGNPPFGHAGESAIQEWFETGTMLDNSGMAQAEQQDLLKFEGNAFGFRTLCTLQNHPQPGGLQLTSAVLGTFSKYPRASDVDSSQKEGSVVRSLASCRVKQRYLKKSPTSLNSDASLGRKRLGTGIHLRSWWKLRMTSATTSWMSKTASRRESSHTKSWRRSTNPG